MVEPESVMPPGGLQESPTINDENKKFEELPEDEKEDSDGDTNPHDGGKKFTDLGI